MIWYNKRIIIKKKTEHNNKSRKRRQSQGKVFCGFFLTILVPLAAHFSQSLNKGPTFYFALGLANSVACSALLLWTACCPCVQTGKESHLSSDLLSLDTEWEVNESMKAHGDNEGHQILVIVKECLWTPWRCISWGPAFGCSKVLMMASFSENN